MQHATDTNTRRVRLFELLRQGNQAKTTHGRLRRAPLTISAADIAALQHSAMKSLQARPQDRAY